MIRKLTLLFCFSLFFSSPVLAGTFFQWTDSSGSVHFADDAKRIPVAYLRKAVERSFSDLKDRNTVPSLPASEYQASLEGRIVRAQAVRDAVLPVNPNRLEDCSQAVTITRERRNVREGRQQLNSTFHVVRDFCGDEVSVTREQPRVLLLPLGR